jgi:hypothetical protein
MLDKDKPGWYTAYHIFSKKFYAIFYFKHQLVVVAEFEGGVRPPLIKVINLKAVESHSGSPRLFYLYL